MPVSGKSLGFPGRSEAKASAGMRETRARSLGQEDPLEKEMATHSSTCLENPMEGGAWWATVHGVSVGHKLVTKQQQMGIYDSKQAWKKTCVGPGEKETTVL